MYYKMVFRLMSLTLIGGICLSACTTVDVFEKNVPIPGQQWSSTFKPELDFDITDTVSAYDIFVVIRHSDAYRYQNLWLNIVTKVPGDSAHAQRIDLRLATDSDGWLGTGMDDIYEHRILLARSKLPKAGRYKFLLENIMREDPLQHVLNAGIRVEKAKG